MAWVAYAILMAPSLGFVQHGFLSITADRYSYLPSVIIAPILAGFGTRVGVCLRAGRRVPTGQVAGCLRDGLLGAHGKDYRVSTGRVARC